MARRRLAGAIKVRRMLKRLPEDVSASLVKELERAKPVILAAARSETPFKTGALQRAIEARVFPKTLRLRVGVLSKRKARDVFYGWILEVGRRAQIARRRGKSGRFHNVRVRAISPAKYDIVQGRTRALARRLLRPALNRAYEDGLRRAAQGSFDV